YSNPRINDDDFSFKLFTFFKIYKFQISEYKCFQLQYPIDVMVNCHDYGINLEYLKENHFIKLDEKYFINQTKYQSYSVYATHLNDTINLRVFSLKIMFKIKKSNHINLDIKVGPSLQTYCICMYSMLLIQKR
ncbi:hypothetical protein HZS_5434, partial [Henneguya salminicola]